MGLRLGSPGTPFRRRLVRGDTIPPIPAAPATPSTPSPAAGAVALSSLLSWVSARATSADVYLGTSATPPLLTPFYVGTTYVPTLLPATTYYWQIVARNSGGTAAGPIWSFTTPAATAVLITIAGVRTTHARVDGCTIHDALNAAPNTATLVLDTTAPTEGHAVEIGLGSLDAADLLFSGEIQDVGERYVDTTDSPLWACTLIDHTFTINKRRPFGTYDQSVSLTAIDLVMRYAPSCSTAGIQAGLPSAAIVFDGSEDFMTCLGRLANAIEDGHADIDYSRTVKLWQGAPSGDAPDPLDVTHPPLNTPSPIAFTTDLSQIRTRGYGKGHGETVPCDVAAGEVIVPIGDASMFDSAGGQAIAGTTSGGAQSEILDYAGVQLGGYGSLVGPGVSPSVAMTLTKVVGTGLSAGTYQYAEVWITAAGHTLPGPTRTIVVGELAGPPNGLSYNDPISGSGLSVGIYNYAYTYVTPTGETLPSAIGVSPFTVIDPTPPAAPVIDNTMVGNVCNFFVIGDTVDVKYAYSWGASYGDPHCVLSPASTFVAADSGQNIVPGFPAFGNYAVNPLVALIASAEPRINTLYVYYQVNGGGYTYASVSRANASGNGSVILGGQTGAIATPGTFKQAFLFSIAVGPSGVTARNLYRTPVGGAGLKFLATIADNTTQEYVDALADGSLGAAPPTVGTALADQVAISAVSLGPAGVTSREIYRTRVNASQLQLQQTIANNTATVGVQDATPDASLGANVPTSDTSGLTQPTGQVNAGSTSLLTAGAPFPAAGGWVLLGSAVVRYTGISGNTLTGIPASGLGALGTTVQYGEHVIALDALTGVNHNNGLARAMAKGSAVHIWVQRDDLAAQTALGLLELDVQGNPTDGIREYLITDERRGTASLTALVDADLARFSRPIVSSTYATRDPNSKSGQTVTIGDLNGWGKTGAFVIQSVTISFDGPALMPLRTVSASSVSFTLADLLRRVVLGS